MRPWSGPQAFCANAANWPLPGKALLGGAVACLVWLLGDTLYLGASRDQLHQQQAREVDLQRQVALKRSEAADLDADARRLQALREEVSRGDQALPASIEIPGLLEDIARLGTANALFVEQIVLLDEQPRPFYIESPLQIDLVGEYHDLATFISAVGRLPRIVTVHDLSISPADSPASPALRLSLQARTYRSSDPAVLASTFAEPSVVQRFIYDATNLRDPFRPASRQVARPLGRPAAEPDPGRPRGFLEGFALEHFEMVGTLSRGAQTFALLRGASAVHRLAVGDYLGPDHGRVTAIRGDGVELVELFPDGEGAWLERSKTLVLNVNS